MKVMPDAPADTQATTPDPAEPADPATQPKASVFGPLDYLIDRAVQADPIVRYGVAALGLVAIGVVALKILPQVVQAQDIRTLIILFLVVLAMTVVFFLITPMLRADNPLSLWAGRILSLVIVAEVVGVVSYVGWAGINGRPCHVAGLLGAADDSCKPTPIPTPTPTPGPQTSARVVGRVVNARDDQMFMPGAEVVLTGAHTITTTSLPTGDFSFDVAPQDVGKTFNAYARKAGFNKMTTRKVLIASPETELELALDPSTDTPTAASFETLSVPTARINPVQLAIASKIAPGLGAAGPAVSGTGFATDWFEGQGFRVDIFYCQPPAGDAVRSKVLATQLDQILRVQKGISATAVKLWPNKAGYQTGNAVVTLNSRPERQTLTDMLRRLWTPYLANNEGIAVRPVNTVFPGYMSVVACRA
jgi:hypothetical protein